MKFQIATLVLAAASTEAFAPLANTARSSVALREGLSVDLPSIESQISYQPGAADTDFARKYGGPDYVNAEVRTVGEAFTAFTKEYGFQVNALYKNMVTDIVGTIHLITVNARFVQDPVWSLGILTALDLLLKNYPEAGMYEKITSALFKSCNLDEATIRADAAMLKEWAEGKTKEDIEAALKSGEQSARIHRPRVSREMNSGCTPDTSELVWSSSWRSPVSKWTRTKFTLSWRTGCQLNWDDHT
jgi:hypothetical protein